MTAFPPPYPTPGVPAPGFAPKKRRGVKIGAALMILGVIAGGVMVMMGVRDVAGNADSTFYELTPGTAFPAVEDGLRGIYSTDEYETGLSLTSNGKAVAIEDVADTSDAVTNFNATVTEDGSEIEVYQKFTFQGKALKAYKLEGADANSSARYFVGKGISGSSIALIGGGVLVGGLLFFVGLIVLIVALVRRGRDRRMVAGYGMPGMQAPGWSPVPGGATPTADPSAPWNVTPGVPPSAPTAPAPPNAPWETAPSAPPAPPMPSSPPPGSEAISDDPGQDGWASPEPPAGS